MNVIKTVSDSVEFYTILESGESGISDSGLEFLIGASTRTVGKLKETLQTKAPSKTLEPFVGQNLTLQTKAENGWVVNGVNAGNLTINKSDFCVAVIEHYAFEARNYKGKEIAVFTYRKFAKMGFDQWVQSITGWEEVASPPVTQSVEQPKLPLPVIMPTPEEIEFMRSPSARSHPNWMQLSGYDRALEAVRKHRSGIVPQ